MSIMYQPCGSKGSYILDYRELADCFSRYAAMTNNEFKAAIPEILHYACIVACLKGLGAEATLSDEGIIHELVHLLVIPDEPMVNINQIRGRFDELLCLVR
jgi:hypothetical protein